MINKNQSNFIKLVAVIAMTLDHLGKYLFPIDILRVIGRIAFPLFAYQIGVGYKMTSSKKSYFKRLIFFGLISQIPYYLLDKFFIFNLNILFSLALAVFTIWSLEKRKFLSTFLILPFAIFVEYQIYGLLTVLIFYFLKNKNYQVILFSLITIAYSFYFNLEIQLFAFLALPIILRPIFEIKLPKSFFYIFYPAHLAIIYLIKITFF